MKYKIMKEKMSSPNFFEQNLCCDLIFLIYICRVYLSLQSVFTYNTTFNLHSGLCEKSCYHTFNDEVKMS